MEIEKSLTNILEISNLDFNSIGVQIENNFGSIDSYNNYLEQLIKDFEKAIAVYLINKSKEELEPFFRINILKIDTAIETISSFENICKRKRETIESDKHYLDLIDNLFMPVYSLHNDKLRYIKRLIEQIYNKDNESSYSSNFNEEFNADNNCETNDFWADLPETLNMNQVKDLLKVKRNAIYAYEKEGHFKRCSPKNKTVIFKKEDIKRYLQSK